MQFNLPADPDRAAAFVLADLTRPDGSYPPERAVPDYAERMADAGVMAADRSYILRSLTRQSIIIETAWLRIMASMATTTHPPHLDALARTARKLHTDLTDTLGAIYKVRKDQREGFEPLLLAQDWKLADAPPPPGLTTLERVQADMVADAVFDAEFKEPAGTLVQGGDAVN